MDAIEVYDWIARTGFAGGLLYILREAVKAQPSWMPTSFHHEIVGFWKTQNAEQKEHIARLLNIQEKQSDDIDSLARGLEKLATPPGRNP